MQRVAAKQRGLAGVLVAVVMLNALCFPFPLASFSKRPTDNAAQRLQGRGMARHVSAGSIGALQGRKGRSLTRRSEDDGVGGRVVDSVLARRASRLSNTSSAAPRSGQTEALPSAAAREGGGMSVSQQSSLRGAAEASHAADDGRYGAASSRSSLSSAASSIVPPAAAAAARADAARADAAPAASRHRQVYSTVSTMLETVI